MKMPCEMKSDVLPAIRAELAKVLVEDYGCTQTKAADLIGVNRAAVSQFKSEVRGNKITFSNEVHDKIKQTAGYLRDESLPEQLKIKSICDICKIFDKM